MALHGAQNLFPCSVPPLQLRNGYSLREYIVGDLRVPLVSYEVNSVCNGDDELNDGVDGEPDETGCALWPSSTLVVCLLLRCQRVLGDHDILELGSGSGFCGLVARQLARRVVFSDREPRIRALVRRNLRIQTPRHGLPESQVEDFGWAIGDSKPVEKFGVVIASDVLYGAHCSLRTCPHELRRFVELLELCLAPGGHIIIGHVERNCMARADLQQALRQHFLVRLLRSDECLSAALHSQPGNAGARCSVALLCTRADGYGTLLAVAAEAPELKAQWREPVSERLHYPRPTALARPKDPEGAQGDNLLPPVPPPCPAASPCAGEKIYQI